MGLDGWTLEPIDLPINSWISVPEGQAPFSGRVPVCGPVGGLDDRRKWVGTFPKEICLAAK